MTTTTNITKLNNLRDSKKVLVIAEACDNHLGDMGAAKEMIVQAKLAGADVIKFQHHLPDEEMLPDSPMSDNFDMPLYEFLKKHALTLKQHIELRDYCDRVGIAYLCTPFSWKAAQELQEIGVQWFKIGSGEMTDVPTLVRIASFKKPMILSTGMCSFDEIDRTYRALKNTGIEFSLMNCISEYPPVYDDVNLGVISEMQKRFPAAIIGHSDHTSDLFTCFGAVALGAKIIEKHVILDKRQPGPDQSVSIDFKELAELVDGVRKVSVALGTEKKVHEREQQIRKWAFRSLVTVKAVRKGEKIPGDSIWSKRPGTGIPSFRMEEVVGRVAKRDLPVNTLISFDDLES